MSPSFAQSAQEAEAGLISAFHRSPLIVGAKCSEARIEPAHFLSPNHSEIFSAMMSRWTSGAPMESGGLLMDLRAIGITLTIHELHGILTSFPTANLADEHIATLLASDAARKAHKICREVADTILGDQNAVAGILDAARAGMESLVTAPETEKTGFRYHAEQFIANLELSTLSENAINFGIGLDEKAGPFCRGDLIIVAGPSGGGKSALAGNMIENAAESGFRCAIFSLEMAGFQVVGRMLASQARVDTRSLAFGLRTFGQPTQQHITELNRLGTTLDKIKDWKIEIIKRAGSLPQVLAKCRQLHSGGGLDVAVIDYAQLMEGIREKGETREREVASISRNLKMMAADLGLAVILLSQLNDDGRLRESRALGQDADVVLFIEKEASLIRVGKARSAPTGAEISVNFIGRFTRFETQDD